MPKATPVVIMDYSEEQERQRTEIRRLIKIHQQIYLDSVRPLIDRLVEIDAITPSRVYFIPREKAMKARIIVRDLFNDCEMNRLETDNALSEIPWIVRDLLGKYDVLAALSGGNDLEVKIIPIDEEEEGQ